MIVRVDKCSTFGIKKSLTKSIQYLPKLLINNKLHDTRHQHWAFFPIFRKTHHDFNMTDKEHKIELVSVLEDIMSEIDLKPLHQKTNFCFTVVIFYPNALGILPLL